MSRPIITWGLGLFCFVLSGTQLLSLRAHYLLNEASSKAGIFGLESKNSPKKLDQSDELLRSETLERQEALEAAKRSAHVSFSSSKAAVQYATMLRRQANREENPLNKIAGYCEALSELGSALKREPEQARLLMGWANIRQLLGQYDCNLPLTQGDYQAVVERAIKADPTDTQVKYVGGLVYLWDGKRDKAYQLFRDTLFYGTSLPEAQRDIVHSQVNDIESLQAIIPGRFPQILDFSYYVHATSSRAHPEFRTSEFIAVLSQLQKSAIEESISSYENDKLPFELHLKRLVSLLELVSVASVRQFLDKELSRLFLRKGDRALSEYSLARSKLDELAILRASISSDTRPQKTPLTNWGENELVALDNFYESVGFYLPDGQSPRVLELSSTEPGPLASSIQFRVLVSADNQNWSEIVEGLKMTSFDRNGKLTVTLQVPPRPYKYWKVAFTASTRDNQIKNYLDKLIKVFGTSIRESAT